MGKIYGKSDAKLGWLTFFIRHGILYVIRKVKQNDGQKPVQMGDLKQR